MKAKSVALLAVTSMLLTSVSVYSLTPPGGVSAWKAPDTVVAVGTEALPEPGQVELSRFSAGSTLTVEGRVGSPKLLKNGRGETFVMLEVRGGDVGAAKVAPPVNLSLVMDRSGSMKGTRLRNAINAATQAVDRLRDGDTVSVVAFDNRARVIVTPTTISPGERERINAEIRGITLGGDTCISCGLEDGIFESDRTMGKVNRMIVLSDGDATAGVRDIPGFRSIAQRARERGISVTTIGVDVDYNEKILSAISQESNGRHYFVENDAALSRVFEAEADALTSTIASGAEASIELAPGVELDRVFDRSFRRVGNRVIVPLGTFSKSDVKTILLKVRVPSQAEGTIAVAGVDLGYKDLVTNTDGKCSGTLGAVVTASSDEARELDSVVAGRVQRSETAAVLKDANVLFAQGRVGDARRKLELQANNVQSVSQGAAGAAPPARAADIDRDFKNQIAALNEANAGFASPPVAAAPQAQQPGSFASPPPAPAPPPQESRQGKASVRRNAEKADAFGF